jgi:hypothetical protein
MEYVLYPTPLATIRTFGNKRTNEQREQHKRILTELRRLDKPSIVCFAYFCQLTNTMAADD